MGNIPKIFEGKVPFPQFLQILDPPMNRNIDIKDV